MTQVRISPGETQDAAIHNLVRSYTFGINKILGVKPCLEQEYNDQEQDEQARVIRDKEEAKWNKILQVANENAEPR